MHHPALALPGGAARALPASCFQLGKPGAGLRWGGVKPRPLGLPWFLNRVGSQVSRAWGEKGSPERLPQCPLSLAWAVSREHLPVGSQRLPQHGCQFLPSVAETRGSWRRGKRCRRTAALCRPALFSPSAHPGEQEGWERGGRTQPRVASKASGASGHEVPMVEAAAALHPYPPEPMWDPASVLGGVISPCHLGQDARTGPGCCGGQLQKS